MRDIEGRNVVFFRGFQQACQLLPPNLLRLARFVCIRQGGVLSLYIRSRSGGGTLPEGLRGFIVLLSHSVNKGDVFIQCTVVESWVELNSLLILLNGAVELVGVLIHVSQVLNQRHAKRI